MCSIDFSDKIKMALSPSRRESCQHCLGEGYGGGTVHSETSFHNTQCGSVASWQLSLRRSPGAACTMSSHINRHHMQRTRQLILR